MSTSMQSISLHFCGGKLAGIGLFEFQLDNDGCCDESNLICQKTTQEKDCCDDQFIQLNWDLNLTHQNSESINLEFPVVQSIPQVNPWVNSQPITICKDKSYFPQLPVAKRSILFQQFLI